MTSKVSRHVENYIDEQCRILNMNGTSHGSALHLAQWMKGQFDDSVKINFLIDNKINKSNDKL